MYRGFIGEIGTVVAVEAQSIAIHAPKACRRATPLVDFLSDAVAREA